MTVGFQPVAQQKACLLLLLQGQRLIRMLSCVSLCWLSRRVLSVSLSLKGLSLTPCLSNLIQNRPIPALAPQAIYPVCLYFLRLCGGELLPKGLGRLKSLLTPHLCCQLHHMTSKAWPECDSASS